VTKFRLKHSFIFVLITAFLTMQCATAHIHVAESHEHDGGQHRHNSEAHSHPIFNQHSDSLDSTHHSDVVDSENQFDYGVIELDHQCITTKVKHKESPSILASVFIFTQHKFSLFSRIDLSVTLSTKLNYLDRSIVYLRGPPQLS
jgi:hypothetical protein